MRLKLTVVCLLLLFLSATRLVGQPLPAHCETTLGEWKPAAPAPENHLEGASAVVDNKLFVFTGFKDSSLKVTNRVDVYNPALDVWETVTNPRRLMPAAFSHSQAAVDGQSVWLAGGFAGDHPGPATDAVWQYDTVEDLWYQGPDLPQRRAGGLLIRQDRYLHYIGGTASDRDTSFADHWRLNLDNSAEGWQAVSVFPEARIHVSGAYLDGMIYAIGGQFNHDHDPVDLSFLHAFNVGTNQWTRKADLPFPRSHFEPGTIVSDGRIIIVGGRANQNGFGFGQIVNVTEYNPATDTWRELTPLPIKLIAPVAVRIEDKIIVTNGGTNWNTGQTRTFVSQITYSNCQPTATEMLTETTLATTTTLPITPTAESSTALPSETLLPSTPVLSPTPLLSETPVPIDATATIVQPSATGTVQGQQIERLTLINALTDQPISDLYDGFVIDCAQLGTSSLNILVTTRPTRVGSVHFALNDDLRYAIENGAPYAIGGNTGGDFASWTPPNGQIMLTVTPFTSSNGQGTAGATLTLNLTVVNCVPQP